VARIKQNPLYSTFEEARTLYPGTKRGYDTELKNFLKKNEIDIMPCLYPAIQKQIEWRKKSREAKSFVPMWKNFSTWVNQKCWEDILPEIEKIESNKFESEEESFARFAKQREDNRDMLR